MALAIIGGEPARFNPFAELHAARRPRPAAPSRAEHQLARLRRAQLTGSRRHRLPGLRRMMDRIGRERGWPPMSRAAFEASRRLEGAHFVGSPAEVAEKILFQHAIFGHDRFLIQFSVGHPPPRRRDALDRALRHRGRPGRPPRAGSCGQSSLTAPTSHVNPPSVAPCRPLSVARREVITSVPAARPR